MNRPLIFYGNLSHDKLETLTQALQKGRAIIYPTETYFGIGCDALSEEAVAFVYQAKGRSTTKPLPLIASDMEMVARCCDLGGVPESLLSFWPGPLTILLPARVPFAKPLADAEGRVAIRISSNYAASKIAEALGRPITATSANMSGCPPQTRSVWLDQELVAKIGIGAFLCATPGGGAPSTIVSVTKEGTICVHREGAVSREKLEKAGLVLAKAPSEAPAAEPSAESTES